MKRPLRLTWLIPRKHRCILALTLGMVGTCFAQTPPSGAAGITLSDPGLRAELLDSHPNDFFLSHDMDLSGRLFLGTREAVYRFDRDANGGFLPRQEIYRFPADTWVYDIEAFGDDLLLLTNTALYRVPGGAKKTRGLKPIKILWGNPLGHHHQGLHGMEFAPDGSLLIAFGDPHPGIHLLKSRPDHFWHWTWYVGPENRPQRYTGVGGVVRLDLDSWDLSLFASGLRNPCGISFNRDWQLFANDNDQEGSTATPCRLVQVPANSWNGWARGWDSSQNPKRRDMLPTANWELDVPVGQGYYDHTALGEAYQDSLFVANWGSRSVDQYPLRADGAGYKASQESFLVAAGLRRPVSAMPANDGSLLVSLCYMNGNEGSPKSPTDLIRVSPRKQRNRAAFDHSQTPLIDLLSASIQLRAKAHREMLRRGGDELQQAATAFQDATPDHPAFSSLIFLAAAQGDAAAVDRIRTLTQKPGRVGALAWRAAAAYPSTFAALTEADVLAAATKTDDPVVLAGLLEFLHAAQRPIPEAVAKLAAHDDLFVCQSAALLLARQAPDDFLARLAQGEQALRLAAALATSFRVWEAAENVTALPEGSTMALEKHMVLTHPDGKIDLRDLAPKVGIFMLADWWHSADVRAEQASSVARLRSALGDSDDAVALAAAVGLFFLDDAESNEAITEVLARNQVVLSIGAGSVNKKEQAKALAALKKATLSTETDIPEAFRGIDWDTEKKAGNHVAGKKLFTQRGCIACHLTPDEGTGGAIGPTLVGVGERFAPSYLAASMLVPNLTVSPNFHPNTVTMKDGTIHTGYVKQDGDANLLRLRIITGQLIELEKADIEKQNASEQSMMPAGLIHTPDEMRDMIAYLQVGTATKKGAAPPKKQAPNAKQKKRQQQRKKQQQKQTQSTAKPAAVVEPQVIEEGFTSMFNGKDFGDWDARKGAWEIKNGTINCTGTEKTRNWIIWRKTQPADFILRLDVKYGAGNSGVQVRSDDLGNHQIFGYQVEIAPQKKMGLWHHSLLGKEDPAHGARFFMATAGQEVTIDAAGKKTEKQVSPHDEIVAHCRDGEWTQMEIIAKGNTLTQKINGVVFSVVQDDDKRMSRKQGFIALQDHGKGCQVAFRNIRLKMLPAEGK